MFIISEFGAAGTFAPDKVAGDALPVRIILHRWRFFAKYDFIARRDFVVLSGLQVAPESPARRAHGMVEMGVVDENRQRYPSFYLWKEVNSPAAVDLHWQQGVWQPPSGFTATVTRRGEDTLPSYTLRGYRAEWELRGADGTVTLRGRATSPTSARPTR